MTFLAPIGLLALSVPVAIYVIHILFGSRKRLRVSAVFLWADLPHASVGRSRRRLPPFTLLLALQLLAAAAAALALARPAAPGDPPRHVALVLDASASMQATDVAPSRFESARARAAERLNSLNRATDLVTLIRAGRDATILASGPPDAVRAALDTARPGLTAPAIREALALASTQVASTPERQGHIVLVTDAAWPQPDSVGQLAAPVEVVPTGGGSENQGLTNVVIRLDPTGRGQDAFVEVANEAAHAVSVPLRVTADGAPLDERQVNVAPRTRARVSVPLPLDARRVEVRLLGHDSLALDDVLQTLAPGGPARDVLLLGRASDGLRRALESMPTVHVRTTDSARAADLTVLSGVLPAQLPPGPLLLVDPPSNSGRLLGVGLGSGARVVRTHPLLQGVDLAAFDHEVPSVGGVPGWAHPVLGTLEGPLLMEGRLEGHAVVAMTFDPAISGLEKSLAFPLLLSNATSFLFAQTDAGVAPASSTAEVFDPNESDIAPRAIPTFASASPVGGAVSATSLQIWPWLLGAALALLGAEWLVFARRG